MKFLKAYVFAWATYAVMLDLSLVAVYLILSFITWQLIPIGVDTILTGNRVTLVIAGLAALGYCFSKDGQRDWR